MSKLFFTNYIRSNHFYLALLGILFITFFVFITSLVTYKTVDKTILDLGFSFLTFFIISKAALIGSSYMKKEEQDGTLHFLLGQGISRTKFYLSHSFSSLGILFSNQVIISISLYMLYAWFVGFSISNFFCVSVFIFVTAILVYGISNLFSFFVNSYISFCLVLSLYFFSNLFKSIQNSKYFPEGVVKNLLSSFNFLLPDFFNLNIINVLGEKSFSFDGFGYVFAHGLSYALAIFFINLIIFSNREFK